MIKLYSPLLYITRCVTLFSLLAVNALGVWHFHPPSDIQSSLLKGFVLAASTQVGPDHHEDEHRDHGPNSDIEHGCDLCWLQLIAKTSYLPQSTTIYLQDFGVNIVRYFPSLRQHSFLEILSFLVRGPPALALS